MRIAIIGSGISGLTAAHLLHPDHQITLFEAGDRLGGHTNTVMAEHAGRHWPVDTGFIVYNDRTYPNFSALLRRLNVETHPSDMGFSVRCEQTGLEYCGSSLNALFAQRRNLLRPSFIRMIRDILRFYREARVMLDGDHADVTLGQFLERGRYSRAFIEQHLIPMGASVWSAAAEDMFAFPAQMFVRFFENHGFLDLKDRPQWRVVTSGSQRYIEPLIRPFRDRIRLATPIEEVRRHSDHVEVKPRGGETECFDEVVFACHSDQALSLLSDPTAAEREILGAIPYQRNEATLHTDISLMPRSRRAWAAWNYHRTRESSGPVTITYNMNILQGLDAPVQFLVSLNRTDAIDPAKVLKSIVYHHPVFTRASVAAQARHSEISGVGRTHYCGAYWANGFHEDGVNSAIRVCGAIGRGVRA